MDTASRLVYLVSRPVSQLVTIAIIGFAALLAALVGAVLIADLLAPSSEPIIAAPLRWR